MVGTPDKLAEHLSKLRDLGLGYAITYFVDAAYDRSSIDLFASKVIPELS
jgi:hypothetical protein